MHTVRPVKRVDTVGSLRLSAEYVGSMRSPPGSPHMNLADGVEGSNANSNGSGRSGKLRKRNKDEIGNAGKLLVDQVVLPTLKNVVTRITSTYS